jgi:hypothetical protein
MLEADSRNNACSLFVAPPVLAARPPRAVWIARSPEEIASLFDAINSEPDAPSALASLVAIAARQQFAVANAHLEALLAVVGASDALHGQALTLLGELTTFNAHNIMNFISSYGAVRVVWSRFPSAAAARVLTACLRFDPGVVRVFTDPAIRGDVAALMDPATPGFEFVLDLFGEVFARFTALLPPMDRFLEIALALLGGGSRLFWNAAVALRALLEGAPALVVAQIAAHLPGICARGVDDDDAAIVLQLLALVARAAGDLGFFADPAVASFVAARFSADEDLNDVDQFFVLSIFDAADDVSAVVEAVEIVRAVAGFLKTDQKVEVKVMAVRFLCRLLVCAGAGQRLALLAAIDFPLLLEFLEVGGRDVRALIIAACAAVADCAERCPFDMAEALAVPGIAEALADVAQTGGGEEAEIAARLIDAL